MLFQVKKVVVGKWKVNCYHISFSNEVWLIDPGDDAQSIITNFELNNYKNIKGILLTHGHFDHIGAVDELSIAYNLPVYIHSKDLKLVSQANLFRKIAGDFRVLKTPRIDNFLENFPEISIGWKKIKTFNLTGHTEGGVCFSIDNNLFIGDLLIGNKIGRSDLPGGNKYALKESLRFIIDNFLGYRIYPGHGDDFYLNSVELKRLNNILNEFEN